MVREGDEAPGMKSEEVKCPAALPGGNKEKQPSLLDQVAGKKSIWAQCLMNGAIILLITGSGMPIGFSAILLPQLQAPESSLPTDDTWCAWIASLHSVMSPVGAVLAGPLMDRLGRRRVLQMSVLPLVAGWLLISAAPSHLCLAAGRMLAGFAVGMIPGSAQVLIGEISEPSLRGVFGSSPNIAYALGILLVYALCSVFPWRVVAALATVLPAASALLLVALPESPVFLVNRGDTDKARKSLLWLRGGDHKKVNQELHLLVVHYKAEQDRELSAAMENEDQCCQVLPEKLTHLNRPEVFKPFLIIFMFCVLQILSGSYIVIFYSVDLISRASGSCKSDLNNQTIAVLTALVRFAVSIVTTVSLLRLGRRKIGIISGIGTAFACFLLVGFLQLKKYRVIEVEEYLDTVIIAALIMVYVAFNTFGIFGLPCMMMGEVLPSRVRGFVSGILLMLISIIIFSTNILYKDVARLLDPSGLFFSFAIVAIFATGHVYLFLPETKDRPLTQIEQYFATGKNFLWASRDKTLMAKNKNFFA